jgi:DNA-binding transcriptional MerR regulator
MAEAPRKSDQAFKTIGELADELAIPQHILRYWETRFPQLRPLQRAGNRRYYRPADVALAHRIHRLLDHDGYTIRGVQQLLAGGEGGAEPPAIPAGDEQPRRFLVEELRALRAQLVSALGESDPF